VRNSVAIFKGKDPIDSNMHFYWTEEKQKPSTMFVPKIAGIVIRQMHIGWVMAL
jgi:hypothetical protein